jgi:hypothetical protein
MLAGDRQVVDLKVDALRGLDRSETELADSYQDGMPYPDFVLAIGDTEHGAIKELTDRLSEPQRSKIGVPKFLLDTAVARIRSS